MPTTTHLQAWPAQLRPGAVRFAHASGNYDATIGFYRDVLGLPVVGEFAGSFGEDGTIFGLPDTGLQLEIVRAHGDTDAAGSFDQLVFYLDDPDAVTAATAPLQAAGLSPDAELHEYWAANAAVSYRDPDGRAVVFAPWVYGRDPEPADRASLPDTDVRVEWYDGDRHALRTLFAEAEDSAEQLDSYIGAGRVLVARRGSDVVGHLQLVPVGETDVELKNMAVEPLSRGTGVGRALIDAAVAACRSEGRLQMLVATGTADVGNLRFYQRCGFRFTRVEQDAFIPATGYPDPIVIDGIPLRDRVWLGMPLTTSTGA